MLLNTRANGPIEHCAFLVKGSERLRTIESRCRSHFREAGVGQRRLSEAGVGQRPPSEAGVGQWPPSEATRDCDRDGNAHGVLPRSTGRRSQWVDEADGRRGRRVDRGTHDHSAREQMYRKEQRPFSSKSVASDGDQYGSLSRSPLPAASEWVSDNACLPRPRGNGFKEADVTIHGEGRGHARHMIPPATFSSRSVAE